MKCFGNLVTLVLRISRMLNGRILVTFVCLSIIARLGMERKVPEEIVGSCMVRTSIRKKSESSG